MLEVSKVVFVAFTQHCIQSNVTHVGGVEGGVFSCIQSNVTHVRGVESELFHILCTPLYEQKIKGYVKGVKRDSKYTIRAHDIFAYNFLNIQPIFNLKKVLKSFQLYHQMLCMLKHVGGVKGQNKL